MGFKRTQWGTAPHDETPHSTRSPIDAQHQPELKRHTDPAKAEPEGYGGGIGGRGIQARSRGSPVIPSIPWVLELLEIPRTPETWKRESAHEQGDDEPRGRRVVGGRGFK